MQISKRLFSKEKIVNQNYSKIYQKKLKFLDIKLSLVKGIKMSNYNTFFLQFYYYH